jgi:conjugative transfer signal peptidase TraF
MTRFGTTMATTFATGMVAVTAVFIPLPRLIWNVSASVPIGLYALHRTDGPPLGSLVAIMPPEPLAGWLATRGYLPRNVPLMKHVAAKAGQRVCRIGAHVSVDGRIIGEALERDSSGRLLPVWKGCRTLRTGELFLMNPAVPDSLDGRYFGPLSVTTIIGRATPLLTRSRPDAPLAWRGIQP